MLKIKYLSAFLLAVAIIGLSACTQNKFHAFDSPNANTQPKTPGYYNPNQQNYAMPQNQQPIVENQFYWKEGREQSAIAPSE